MRSMMRRCNGPHCRVSCRHYEATNDDGQRGWRCGNCSTFTPISVQGQNTPKAIQDVMDKLELKNEYGRDRWSGYCTLDELRMLLLHHTMREVKVSAGTFGLIDLPKKDASRWCRDEYRLRQQQRLEEKTGRPVEVIITLEQDKKPSGWTHSLMIFGFYAFTDDERKNYYPFD